MPLATIVKLIRLFSFFALISLARSLCAQSIEVALIDGRNGHPIADTYVNVWVGTERKDALEIPTDKNGIARLRLTDKNAEMNTETPWRNGGQFRVTNPVLKYQDSIRLNVGYVLCEPKGTNFSWLAIKHFATKRLLEHGIVTTNTCGKSTASAKPGQLVIFLRPLNFWERLKE